MILFGWQRRLAKRSLYLLWLAGATFLLVEVAVRVVAGDFSLSPRLPRPKLPEVLVGHIDRDVHAVRFDDRLGWVPAPGVTKVMRGGPVRILESGVRSNGPEGRAHVAPLILAVGDSFTFGDGAQDWDSWPAHLERILRRPVVNGGVSSYGFDQTVLRAEALVGQFKPTITLVSLIGDDIFRCTLSRRNYAHKPFFWYRDGRLVLDQEPLVPWPKGGAIDLGTARLFLSRSHVIHRVMDSWFQDAWRTAQAGEHQTLEFETQRHAHGFEVACALMERLARLEPKPILIGQWGGNRYDDLLPNLYACAREHGLETIDIAGNTYRAHQTLSAREFENRYGNGHRNGPGNRIVAQQIAASLREQGDLL